MKNDPWVNRSDGMRCVSCIWYCVKEIKDAPSHIGRCRKPAPTMGGYPVVFQTDWCGDHRLDENKIK